MIGLTNYKKKKNGSGVQSASMFFAYFAKVLLSESKTWDSNSPNKQILKPHANKNRIKPIAMPVFADLRKFRSAFKKTLLSRSSTDAN